MPQRTIFRPDFVSVGEIRQKERLLYVRVNILDTMLVWVQAGCKILRWAGNELTVNAGEMAVLAANQTFDVLNEPDSESRYYQAVWLVADEQWISRFVERCPQEGKLKTAVKKPLDGDLLKAADGLIEGIKQGVPPLVAEARLLEMLTWLAGRGIAFAAYEKPQLVHQI